MIVVICKLGLRFPAVQSLKEKRQILKKIISRTQNRFSLAIAEVGKQDLWQRSEIGFCFIGSDSAKLHGLVDRAVTFIEDLHLSETLSQEKELVRL